MYGVMSGSRGPINVEGRAEGKGKVRRWGRADGSLVMGLEGAGELRRAGAGD